MTKRVDFKSATRQRDIDAARQLAARGNVVGDRGEQHQAAEGPVISEVRENHSSHCECDRCTNDRRWSEAIYRSDAQIRALRIWMQERR